MEDKWSKVIVHASAFFAPVLVPILFFLISSDEHVKRLSIQALLFQGVMWVLTTVSVHLFVCSNRDPFLNYFWYYAISSSDYRYCESIE